jgi:hypothetical protein
MAQKRKKKRTVVESISSSGDRQPTHWMIISQFFGGNWLLYIRPVNFLKRINFQSKRRFSGF